LMNSSQCMWSKKEHVNDNQLNFDKSTALKMKTSEAYMLHPGTVYVRPLQSIFMEYKCHIMYLIH
jgi:hypothetical protein